MSDGMEDKELLYRQVHPTWIEDGHPTSQGFRPTPKDQGKLSLDRSTIFSAEDSFKLHSEVKVLASAGTWGVTVGEFGQTEIQCCPDPIEASVDTPANPAHALADFSPHAQNRWKLMGKKLRNFAVGRGRRHPPS